MVEFVAELLATALALSPFGLAAVVIFWGGRERNARLRDIERDGTPEAFKAYKEDYLKEVRIRGVLALLVFIGGIAATLWIFDNAGRIGASVQSIHRTWRQ